jgi:hypothetical protein
MKNNSSCSACGSPEPQDTHHVGGRTHSDITVPACVTCNQRALNQADTYGRDWSAAAYREDHQAIGILDLAQRLCDAAGFHADADRVLRVVSGLGPFCGFRARPAARAPDPAEPTPRGLVRAMRQITAAWERWCVETGMPVTGWERRTLDRLWRLLGDTDEH